MLSEMNYVKIKSILIVRISTTVRLITKFPCYSCLHRQRISSSVKIPCLTCNTEIFLVEKSSHKMRHYWKNLWNITKGVEPLLYSFCNFTIIIYNKHRFVKKKIKYKEKKDFLRKSFFCYNSTVQYFKTNHPHNLQQPYLLVQQMNHHHNSQIN